MNHLLDWHQAGDDAWEACLDRALHHFDRKGHWTETARRRSIALLFFNPSLRTRTSMELAAAQLGAHSTTLTPGQGTWTFAFDEGTVMDGDEAEHIRDAVGVLSRYYDAIGVRLFASLKDYEKDRKEQLLRVFAGAARVPVVNLESAFHHPCQALADAAAIRQCLGDPSRRRFVLSWTYHPKALPMAVPNSAMLMAARSGMDVVVARPDEYALDRDVIERARSYSGRVSETADMDEGFDDADVVYAKAWGGPLAYEDAEREQSIRSGYRDWRVTEARMRRTDSAVFMHCLPVRRNVVVDDAVIDGTQSIHLLQAEFRLHAQKAILEYVWGL